MDFALYLSLDVNLPKTKIMMFGCNKRKFKQEEFYVEKDQFWDNPWI